MYPEKVMIVLFMGIAIGMLIELIIVLIINTLEEYYESNFVSHDHDDRDIDNVNSGGCK